MPLYPAADPALIVSPPQTRPLFYGPLHAKNSAHVLRPSASSIYLLAWVAVFPAAVPYVRPEKLLRKLLRSLPRDAHGAGVRPIRPAATSAAHDLSQSTSVLPPSYAPIWPAGVLQGCVLRDVLRRVLWTPALLLLRVLIIALFYFSGWFSRNSRSQYQKNIPSRRAHEIVAQFCICRRLTQFCPTTIDNLSCILSVSMPVTSFPTRR
ncbi:hypothetical protein C8Q79DRAFT_214211 [Trametes meyenii]|nr:hypothetical protein C8Q79DRAFT_214211 [Trametes meyenii]